MNIFTHTITTRIFIASVGMLWLVISWSFTGAALAQQGNTAEGEDIPILGDDWNEAEMIKEANWFQEAIWAVQWIYLPQSLEQVHALYGYSFSDIENCKEVCNVEISEPVIVYHQGDDDNSSTLKLDWYRPDSFKDQKFELNTIINKKTSQPEAMNEHWYLATDTFIPGVKPTRSYVINKP